MSRKQSKQVNLVDFREEFPGSKQPKLDSCRCIQIRGEAGRFDLPGNKNDRIFPVKRMKKQLRLGGFYASVAKCVRNTLNLGHRRQFLMSRISTRTTYSEFGQLR